MFGIKNTISENILILGLGGVGFYLAKRLAHEGYTITVIESEGRLDSRSRRYPGCPVDAGQCHEH